MEIHMSRYLDKQQLALGGRDGHSQAEQMRVFEASMEILLSNSKREGAVPLFASDRVDLDDMSLSLRWAHERAGEVIDPHTAIGLSAARRADLPADVPVVTLATAHPAKFRDAVARAP